MHFGIRRVGKDNIDFGKMRYHFSAMSVVNLDAARGNRVSIRITPNKIAAPKDGF